MHMAVCHRAMQVHIWIKCNLVRSMGYTYSYIILLCFIKNLAATYIAI